MEINLSPLFHGPRRVALSFAPTYEDISYLLPLFLVLPFPSFALYILTWLYVMKMGSLVRRLAPVQRKLSTASSLQRTSSCTLPEKTQDFYELFESLLYLEIDSTWRAGVLMRLGPSAA